MVSLISGQGYFPFLSGHTKHNIHNREGGRKENNQTRTWFSSKLKNGKVCDTFLAFGELSRACIRAKFPQSHQECWLIISCWPNQPLVYTSYKSPFLTVSFPWLLLTVQFSALVSSGFFCSLLLAALDLPSLVLLRSRGKSHVQALCVGFTPKQTKESSY